MTLYGLYGVNSECGNWKRACLKYRYRKAYLFGLFKRQCYGDITIPNLSDWISRKTEAPIYVQKDADGTFKLPYHTFNGIAELHKKYKDNPIQYI